MISVRVAPVEVLAILSVAAIAAMDAAAGGSTLPGVPQDGAASTPLLTRVETYVTRYYDRVQSIVALERVTVQALNRDLTANGFARRLLYETRMEWNPAAHPKASVVRELVQVNGRAARPDEEPRCTDPRAISPEPLALLLPDERRKYVFHPAGSGKVDGRGAAVFTYRALHPEAPRVQWEEDCALIDLPGRTRGRVWVDPDSGDVLRFDEQLIGLVDIPVPAAQQRRGAAAYMTVERADTSIRYAPVTFVEPPETVMLPAAVESVVIIRNSGSPRLRITQTFSDYRRFVTSSRIVR